MGTGEFNAGGNPAMDWHPIQGGVEIFLVASCHGNRDKLRPDGPLGSYVDFTLPLRWSRHCSQSTPRKFENGAVFLRLGLPSRLIHREKGAFRMCSSNRRNLKTLGLRFSVGGNHFETRCSHNN